MRAHNIKRAILSALRDTHPFLLPESTLFADMNLRLSEPVSTIEFQSALKELEGQRRILSIPQEEEDTRTGTPRMKWKITDDGLARLNELLR